MKEKRINTIKWIIIGLHFLFAVFASRFVFVKTGENPSGTFAVNNILDDTAEMALAHVCSVVFACGIIFLLWTLIFHIIKDFKKSYIPFIAVFIIGAGVIFLAWPEFFAGPDVLSDNLVTFSCAVRLTPDYWHSFYTSIIYAAALLAFPMTMSITLLQWAFFVYALAYVSHRAREYSKPLSYAVFLVFLFPNVIEIMTYGHRADMYVILLVLFAAKVIFDVLDKKKIGTFELICMAVFAAFLSVWRSEGIIVGLLFFAIYLFYVSKSKAKGALIGFGCFILAFLLISVPQKIGDKKYYGSDYSIINSFEPLRFILNDKEANLSYEGADEDLEAIDAVLPIEIVKEYGTDGYRSYNNTVRGNADINQSGTDDRTGKAFLSAYRRIIMHNPAAFSKVKVNMAVSATGLKAPFESPAYEGEHNELMHWNYIGWTNGEEDYYSGKFISFWRNVSIRNRIGNKLLRIRKGIQDTAKNKGIYAGLLAVFVLSDIFVIAFGLIKKDNIALSFFAGITLLSLAAIVVTMPVGATIYYFTSSALILLIIFSFVCKMSKKTSVKKK